MGNFKLQTWHLIVLGLIFCVATGIVTIKVGEKEEEGNGTITPPTEMLIVNKPLKFVFNDKYSSTDPPGTGAYLYDSTGKNELEGGASKITNQTWETEAGYRSDTNLILKYVYDTANDDVFWHPFTVPKMTRADAESMQVNEIKVNVFSLPTLTDDAKESIGGNSISDNGDWNKTSGGNPGEDIATCTYSWYVGSTGDGFLESKDPVYGIDLQAVIWVKVFGTNYESVILTGFDGSYEKGSAMYFYHVIDPTEITKWKVGQKFEYPGAGAFSWTVDLSGYTGDDADMQIYLEVYSSPEYHKQYSSFGPYAVQLAEQTINLVD